MSSEIYNSIEAIQSYLLGLQDGISADFEQLDGARFTEDNWQHNNGAGGGRTRVLHGGSVIEKGGVNFSRVFGDALPSAASAKRPGLAGKPFQAMGVSLVMHPKNPYAPTSHMNVRFFVADLDSKNPVWWFGGGFDMTPFYGFAEDCVHWHQTAFDACTGFGENRYSEYKQWCDDYFFLPHREEQRGIGGVLFDDLNTPDFSHCFEFTKSIGNHYLKAIMPILYKRKDTPFTEQQRQWQLVRRGRYVEFNLVQDRGTLFGLQSKGRTESILMSMPPLAAWEYAHKIEQGSEEQRLLTEFLVPKDWLAR